MFPDVPAKLYITTSVGTRCVTLDPCDQYRTEFEGFAHALIHRTELPIPPDDAVQNMRVIDALFESARSGAWISLEMP